MTIDHKILYNSESISRDYAARDYLEPAERTVLEMLGPELPGMDMLDMGVGGGRTTKYFAPLAGNYTGADYAVAMVDICLDKYGNDYYFLNCDVRDMKELPDNSYDFVLFSFNGIDSFSHKDRMAALDEAYRVLRPDGYFCFSSHNLDWEGLAGIFSFKEKKDPGRGNSSNHFVENISSEIRSACKIARLNILNRSIHMTDHILKLRRNKRGYLYDNSLNGKAKIYYINSNEQIKQLEETGFKNISTICKDGLITSNADLLDKGGWIYYLCRADK
ncbi:MAG: class I SAM-dependent methyltransferase [Actinomycetia bacterium]|nr:class I SAM-dependent methyltransferase [Actinomycetes bacterium]